jgi:hypothetical protein
MRTFLCIASDGDVSQMPYVRNQWRTEGGWGVQTTPPPRNSEVLLSRTGLQIERKMFSVPIPTT